MAKIPFERRNERAKETGNVATHAQQRRIKEALSVRPPRKRVAAAREVIFRWVVLAGTPRVVRMPMARALPRSEARADFVSATAISVPIFLIIRSPKRVPSAINAAPQRIKAVLVFGVTRDAEIARARNFCPSWAP